MATKCIEAQVNKCCQLALERGSRYISSCFLHLSVTSKLIFTKEVIQCSSAIFGSSHPFSSKEPGKAFAGNQEDCGIFLWIFQLSIGTDDSGFKDATEAFKIIAVRRCYVILL